MTYFDRDMLREVTRILSEVEACSWKYISGQTLGPLSLSSGPRENNASIWRCLMIRDQDAEPSLCGQLSWKICQGQERFLTHK